jgi:N-acetylneuraminic acid mutarotase
MFSERNTRAGLRYADSPSSSVRILPSARRGHSLSVINDYIFLFGGYSRGYPCIRGQKIPCTEDAGVNSELWRFDPVTNIWLEINPVNGIMPPSREKHSTVVLSNRLLVFGGRNNNELDATASMNGK